MPETQQSESPLSDWETEIIRLTAFPRQPVDTKTWWREVAETEPAITVPGPSGFRQEFGAVGDSKLALVTTPQRIDWNLSGPDPRPPLPLLSAGKYRSANEQFANLIRRWLPLAPRLTRLAVGVQLYVPVTDSGSANRHISKHLRLKEFDVEAWQDLSFQVNQPVISKVVRDLRINRLARWAFEAFAPAMALTIVNGVPTQSVGQPLPAARFIIDFNTAAEFFDIISPAQVGPLYEEITGHARDLIDRGFPDAR